ncbi:MAG: 3-deoxy-8-phosphooctulonate synthase [bacterium TMED88]|nr:3-deoxy-8-phosphooctulonate synthase [Deltaproteobacteria bacterium]OUV21869.1 MAG: 3-deoxy-8-phosphooctulonate synthase [bacterium TMED88]
MTVRIRKVDIGGGAPLALIAGLNVIEDEDGAVRCAKHIQQIARRAGIPTIFKASFDKANRTRADAYRGPGLTEGLRILEAVRAHSGLPTLTDVHEPAQAGPVAEVVDCLQVPAMLCRQTDLIQACAETGLPLNLKKGQFIAPNDMIHAVKKAEHFGAVGTFLTERGTQFGHRNLVVDMRGLIEMRAFAPVCFDATHSVQKPGAADGASGGDRTMVGPLARAAVGAGIDALFIEVHPDPEKAPVDGPSQIRPTELETLIDEVLALDSALREARRQHDHEGESK